MATRLSVLTALAGWLLLAGCHGTRPATLGVRDGRLAPCPSTPNCVSSLEPAGSHGIEPLPLAGPAATAVARLAQIVRSFPRAAIVRESATYLHAEFTSAFFRFVDDVEFLVDETAGVIHVRSASRLGSSDLGVNRRRIEAVRRRWLEAPQR